LPAQKAFVNQLVHELRTPLAIASGSLKRACVHVPESHLDAREHLSVAEQELRRMRRLVDHLSLLTDVETGSKRWTFLLQSVGELFGEWQRQISPALQTRLVRILCPHLLDECVYVAADALAVVIDNLCDNAMRYSPAGAPVVVMLASAGSVLNLYVADWGSGIPAKQRQHVFDPFRRLEEHRDPARADGSGLGLSVCRSLIEMMHGTIEILPALDHLRFVAPSTVVKVSLPRISAKAIDSNGVLEAFQNSGLNRQQMAGFLAYLERCGEANGWPTSLTA
jgi:signal transduction histidine kinase